eukprot:419641-Amphidinium_carterae.1
MGDNPQWLLVPRNGDYDELLGFQCTQGSRLCLTTSSDGARFVWVLLLGDGGPPCRVPVVRGGGQRVAPAGLGRRDAINWVCEPPGAAQQWRPDNAELVALAAEAGALTAQLAKCSARGCGGSGLTGALRLGAPSTNASWGRSSSGGRRWRSSCSGTRWPCWRGRRGSGLSSRARGARSGRFEWTSCPSGEDQARNGCEEGEETEESKEVQEEQEEAWAKPQWIEWDSLQIVKLGQKEKEEAQSQSQQCQQQSQWQQRGVREMDTARLEEYPSGGREKVRGEEVSSEGRRAVVRSTTSRGALRILPGHGPSPPVPRSCGGHAGSETSLGSPMGGAARRLDRAQRSEGGHDTGLCYGSHFQWRPAPVHGRVGTASGGNPTCEGQGRKLGKGRAGRASVWTWCHADGSRTDETQRVMGYERVKAMLREQLQRVSGLAMAGHTLAAALSSSGFFSMALRAGLAKQLRKLPPHESTR